MPFEIIYVIYFSVFIGVLLVVESIYRIFLDRNSNQRMNRRLRMLAGNTGSRSALLQVRRSFQASDDDPPLQRWAATMLAQAGMEVSLARAATVMGVLAAVAGTAAVMLGQGAFTAVAATVVVGVGLPLLAVLVRRRVRLSAFGRQLPDALEVMVRSLRAGHPLPTAISLVAREMPDPIGSSFGLAADEMTFGLDLSEALRNMADRVGHEDLRLVVISVGIHSGIGGNLSELLANLATIIRARFRMKCKVGALSAEGRFSAIILSLLPPGVASLISIMNPNFYGEVIDHPLFMPIMVGAGVLLVIGDFIMYRMVNFRI